jgi:hypothetical protein
MSGFSSRRGRSRKRGLNGIISRVHRRGTGAEGQPGATTPSPVSHHEANASLVKTTPGVQ